MITIKRLLNYYWPLIILIIIFGFLFANLFLSHMLFQKPGGMYSGGSAWGDVAFHLSLISNFSQRGLQLNSSPLFLGSSLAYPFLPDLISALMVNAGASLQIALIIPSLIFILIAVAMIYLLTFKIAKSKIGAFLAPFLFFFNGTIFGIYYFWQDFQVSHVGFWQFFDAMTKQYTNLSAYNIAFSNIICDYVLPQRTFVMGLAIGLFVIYFLWEYWQTEKRKYLVCAGIALSVIPLIHTHSFVALIIVCAFLALIQFVSGPKDFFC